LIISPERRKNQIAEALATLAAMMKLETDNSTRTVVINLYKRPAYEKVGEEEDSEECASVEPEPDGKPWYYDLRRFLEHQEYPESATSNEKRTIRRLAASYVRSGKVLYIQKRLRNRPAEVSRF
jgi:hypothetical protein